MLGGTLGLLPPPLDLPFPGMPVGGAGKDTFLKFWKTELSIIAVSTSLIQLMSYFCVPNMFPRQ